jgi:Tol biopolymer transport system component
MSSRSTRASLLLAMLVALTFVVPGMASAAGGGAQLTVVAARSHKSPQELLVFGARGQALRSITGWSTALWAEQLAWSPDGQEFAYVAWGFDQEDLFAVNADGSNPRGMAFALDYGAAPVFDPGGDLVVSTPEPFSSEDGSTTYGTVLRAVPTDGLESSPIVSFGPGVRVEPTSISRDGTMAVLASESTEGKGIAVVTPGSDDLRWVVKPGGGEVLSPTISPDGSQIVFLRDRTEGEFPNGPRLVRSELVIVPVGGGKPRRLATIVGGARWPAWDPSGSRITFTALATRSREGSFSPGNHSALMEINSDGSCLTTVYAAKDGGLVWGGAWRPGPGRGAGPISC